MLHTALVLTLALMSITVQAHPPVPQDWPQKQDFANLLSHQVLAKVKHHVEAFHNENPLFRSLKARAQPPYVKELYYIEMLAKYGESVVTAPHVNRGPSIVTASHVNRKSNKGLRVVPGLLRGNSRRNTFLDVSEKTKVRAGGYGDGLLKSIDDGLDNAGDAYNSGTEFVGDGLNTAGELGGDAINGMQAVAGAIVAATPAQLREAVAVARNIAKDVRTAAGNVVGDAISAALNANPLCKKYYLLVEEKNAEIKDLEEVQLPFLQDEQTQAVEQQERISKAVKHCIESCKCSPGLGACQLTEQYEFELSALEAEGRRLALKSSDIKQKIKDANQAITDAGEVDPTCEAIAKVATFITLVLTDFDALIELVTDIFKMAACMLIDIAVEIAGVAIDAALASSFPAIGVLQNQPFCLYMNGGFGGRAGKLLNSGVGKKLGKIAPKLDFAMDVNQNLGGYDSEGNVVELSSDTWKMKLFPIGSALLQGDRQGVALNMLWLAAFAVENLGMELDDGINGGMDDNLRQMSSVLMSQKDLAEFVVTVLINGVCGNFGSALTTILGAIAHCNVCETDEWGTYDVDPADSTNDDCTGEGLRAKTPAGCVFTPPEVQIDCTAACPTSMLKIREQCIAQDDSATADQLAEAQQWTALYEGAQPSPSAYVISTFLNENYDLDKDLEVALLNPCSLESDGDKSNCEGTYPNRPTHDPDKSKDNTDVNFDTAWFEACKNVCESDARCSEFFLEDEGRCFTRRGHDATLDTVAFAAGGTYFVMAAKEKLVDIGDETTEIAITKGSGLINSALPDWCPRVTCNTDFSNETSSWTSPPQSGVCDGNVLMFEDSGSNLFLLNAEGVRHRMAGEAIDGLLTQGLRGLSQDTDGFITEAACFTGNTKILNYKNGNPLSAAAEAAAEAAAVNYIVDNDMLCAASENAWIIPAYIDGVENPMYDKTCNGYNRQGSWLNPLVWKCRYALSTRPDQCKAACSNYDDCSGFTRIENGRCFFRKHASTISAHAGYRLYRKINPAAVVVAVSELAPGDGVMLSGSSTISGSSKMGRYVWTGSDTNGKPAYQFGSNFLYWYFYRGQYHRWQIGPVLGGAELSMYWNNNVARPELSPTPTPITVARYPGSTWVDMADTIVITAIAAAEEGVQSTCKRMTIETCQQLCQYFNDCQHVSYSSAAGACQLLTSCSSVDARGKCSATDEQRTVTIPAAAASCSEEDAERMVITQEAALFVKEIRTRTSYETPVQPAKPKKRTRTKWRYWYRAWSSWRELNPGESCTPNSLTGCGFFSAVAAQKAYHDWSSWSELNPGESCKKIIGFKWEGWIYKPYITINTDSYECQEKHAAVAEQTGLRECAEDKIVPATEVSTDVCTCGSTDEVCADVSVGHFVLPANYDGPWKSSSFVNESDHGCPQHLPECSSSLDVVTDETNHGVCGRIGDYCTKNPRECVTKADHFDFAKQFNALKDAAEAIQKNEVFKALKNVNLGIADYRSKRMHSDGMKESLALAKVEVPKIVSEFSGFIIQRLKVENAESGFIAHHDMMCKSSDNAWIIQNTHSPLFPPDCSGGDLFCHALPNPCWQENDKYCRYAKAGSTVDQCKAACLNSDDCSGFVRDDNNGRCYFRKHALTKSAQSGLSCYEKIN